MCEGEQGDRKGRLYILDVKLRLTKHYGAQFIAPCGMDRLPSRA